MSFVQKEQVLEKLKEILDPALGRVGGVSLTDGKVYVTIETDPEKGAALEPMRQAVEKSLSAMQGVREAHAILTAERSPPPKLTVKQGSASAKSGGGSLGGHKISSRPVAPNVKHMIAVASGKGGVGKSTVAANLAAAFVMLGKKTGLLDADIYGASQPVMMGLREKPATDKNDMIIPPEKDMGGGKTLKLMSMGFFVEPTAPVIWRGPMVHSAIQQLLRDVQWGDLDVLIIDLPPGTGDAQLSLAQYVPLSGAVIVSTPQEVALREAEKGLRMFEKTNVPVLGMIENMSYHICSNCDHREDIFGHGGAREAAERLNVPFLGEVPLQPVIREQADAGVPITLALPKHAVSESFRNIAARLWTALPERKAVAAQSS